ncbi:FAD-dependent oxidoreductase [Nocardiopsis coralli]|uniref:FAD-dependent oxidoreductase n=1 Tax=Nocardiopsis coralli TaxID=2772213 RepID=UPI001C10E622|nr:FAD-dependent oxidoreductase [Nocardiopsis coralli]
MSASAPTSVIVIGGGIGGFASALVLRRLGADVQLLEQAPEFAEAGAGLQMSPNATRLLERWGLLDQAIASGVAPGRVVFRDATTGEDLLDQDVNGEFRERYGAPYIVAHRADLHRLLWKTAEAEGVRLFNDVRIESVDNTPGGARAVAADGREFTADAIVAADGIKSSVRKQLFSDDEPVASEYVAYRGAIPTERASHSKDMDAVVVWLGPECHLVQYPLRGGELFNTVAVYRSESFAAGQLTYTGDDELRAAYTECVPKVRDALDNVDDAMRWPMFDRVPISRWHEGRICLVGDAAHPMLQYLAQGACQALEDAGTLEHLAGELVLGAGGDPSRWPEVFERFTELRREKTAKVQNTARTWGEAWHLTGPVERTVRNMLFRSADRHGIWEYTDWLYGEQPADGRVSADGQAAEAFPATAP